MGPRATHSEGRVINRAAKTLAWLFALTLLCLGWNADAFAQDIQARYAQLQEAAEMAKEMHAVNPSASSLQIMNQAIDTFQRFEEGNRDALRDLSFGQGAPAKTFATGGPDGYGYTYIDSNEIGGPVFSFISITATGTLVAQGDDVSSINSVIFSPVTLGTPFLFYGVDYCELVPATNGYISGDPNDGGPDLSNDCPIPATPSTGFPPRLYVLHDDMVAGGGSGSGSPDAGIWYQYFSTCPHPQGAVSGGCSVFEYADANHFANAGAFFSYEALLFDNGDILYQYADGNPELGSSSTEGIMNETSSIALQYESCNTFGNLADNLAVLYINPTPPNRNTADLDLQKMVDDSTPDAGQNVTFSLWITNLGPGAVFGVRVRDELPAGVTYVSQSGDGTYDPATGIWRVGNLNTCGDSAHIDITVRVDTTDPVENWAFIVNSSTLPDPDPSNNHAHVTLNPRSADLELSKEVIAFQEGNGNATATYKVTVTNNGPDNVCDVDIEDRLSFDMTVIGLSTTQGTVSQVLNILFWDVGCINVGNNAMLTLTVEVPQGGSLLNVAEVTDASLPDPDSTPNDGEGDDFAAAIAGFRDTPDFVRGVGPGGLIDRGGTRFFADLSLTKSVNDATPGVGDNVTYTLTVSNNGPNTTAGVEVTDHLPECLALVSTDPAGVYDGWVWDVGQLKVNKSKTLKITATVTADCQGTVVNIAEVTGSTLPDPDDLFRSFDTPPPPPDDIAEASFTVSAAAAKASAETKLLPGYPNPFNPETVIPFELSEATQVTVRVYDLLGRLVQTLVDGDLSAGVHEVSFRAERLPTGVYLVRMEAAGKVFTQRVTLMK